jgi:pyruvate/2-oxoglutarate/acetoin dehydrogenase E1 component
MPATRADERDEETDVQERQMTMVEALNLALDQALARDPKVFLLGEDIGLPNGVMGVTKNLAAKYGADRVRDTPISEAAIVGAAIGASLNGFRVVAEIMLMDFLPIAMDQILNHAAKLRYLTAGRLSVPITIRCSSIAGGGTPATHSQALEGWLMGIPGIKVVIPSGPADAKGLLASSILDNDPVLFVETGMLYGSKGPVPEDPDYTVPLGQLNVVRAGEDVTIVTYGRGVRESLAAAEQLAQQGVSAEVLDLRTLLPLDVPGILTSVSKTRRAIVVHYGLRFAGPGAEIAATITESLFGELAAPVARLGAKFVPFPSAAELQPEVFPTSADIAKTALTLTGTTGAHA